MKSTDRKWTPGVINEEVWYYELCVSYGKFMGKYSYGGGKVIIQEDRGAYQKVLWRNVDTCLELQRGQVV